MVNFTYNKKESGFTLIEVLVSITVFSLGILAVITMQTTGVSGNAKAQYISEAVNVAAERVELILNSGYSAIVDLAGTNTGVVGLDDGGVTTATTADGSATDASGNYNIFWNVADSTPALNCKTIRVIVTNTQLQAPVSMDFVKVKDI